MDPTSPGRGLTQRSARRCDCARACLLRLGPEEPPARHGPGDEEGDEADAKQLNFVQHVLSMLKINGAAAMVVPDTCCTTQASARKSPAGYCRTAKCTRSCASRTGFSTQTRCSRTCCSSSARPRRSTRRGRASSGVRLPQEPALHPEDAAAHARTPPRLRRAVPAGERHKRLRSTAASNRATACREAGFLARAAGHALDRLLGHTELAWPWLACALLAGELSDEALQGAALPRFTRTSELACRSPNGGRGHPRFGVP